MKNLKILILAIFAFIISLTFTEAAPSFGLEKLFGDLTGYNSGYNNGYNNGYNGYNNGYNGNQQYYPQPTRAVAKSPKPKGRTYTEICRQVNPAPYALPNRLPFPSVPVC